MCREPARVARRQAAAVPGAALHVRGGGLARGLLRADGLVACRRAHHRAVEPPGDVLMGLQVSSHGVLASVAMLCDAAGRHWQARYLGAGSHWLPDYTSWCPACTCSHAEGVAWNERAQKLLTCRLQWVHAYYGCCVAQVIALFSPVSADDADGNGLGGTDSLSVSEQVV